MMNIVDFLQGKLEEFKKLDAKRQKKIYIFLGVDFLISAYISGIFSFHFKGIGLITNILYGLMPFSGLGRTIIFATLIGLFAIFVLYREGLINPVVTEDENGVKYLQDSTFGSARFMSKEQAQQTYSVGDIMNVFEDVYGQFSENGSEVVAYRDATSRNKNTFVLGSSGSGKSFSYVRTAAMQGIIRGDSLVITDPSGELYRDLAKFASDRGCDVKLIDFKDMDYSDGWNCLNECLDLSTKRLDADRLESFVTTYIVNSRDVGAKSEAYWETGAKLLFKTVIGIVAYRHEEDVIEGLTKMLLLVSEKSYGDNIPGEITELIHSPLETVSIVALENKFIETCHLLGATDTEIKRDLKAMYEAARPFNIAEVYRVILTTDNEQSLEYDVKDMPANHPAVTSYFSVFGASSKMANNFAGIRQNLTNTLALLMSPQLRKVVSTENIELQRLSAKQTVCFVIFRDNGDTSIKTMLAIFFSFLITDLTTAYDTSEDESVLMGKIRRRLPVHILLDEVASCGYISNLTTAISNVRKRKVYITMIWQNIAQVIQLYGQEGLNILQSNCNTLLFLGTGDTQTAKYISDLSGPTTVRTQSHSEKVFTVMPNIITEGRVSEAQRMLITPAEAMAANDNVYLFKSGTKNVLKLNRFPYTSHPMAKYLTQVSVKDRTPHAKYEFVDRLNTQTTFDDLRKPYDEEEDYDLREFLRSYKINFAYEKDKATIAKTIRKFMNDESNFQSEPQPQFDNTSKSNSIFDLDEFESYDDFRYIPEIMSPEELNAEKEEAVEIENPDTSSQTNTNASKTASFTSDESNQTYGISDKTEQISTDSGNDTEPIFNVIKFKI